MRSFYFFFSLFSFSANSLLCWPQVALYCRNGTIEFSEFVISMAKSVNDIDAEKEIKEAFDFFYKGGNGHINVEELRYVSVNLGETFSDEDIAEMLKQADFDGDGVVNYKGYTLISKNRSLMGWGGLAFIIKDDIKFKVIEIYLYGLKEAVDCVKEQMHDKSIVQFIENGLNNAIERKPVARADFGKLLRELLTKQLISREGFVKGFRTILEGAIDIIVDIPQLFENLAQILVPALEQDAQCLHTVKDMEQLVSEEITTRGRLAAAVLAELVKSKDKETAARLWHASVLTWESFGAKTSDNVEQLISSKNLDFTRDSPGSHLYRIFKESNRDDAIAQAQEPPPVLETSVAAPKESILIPQNTKHEPDVEEGKESDFPADSPPESPLPEIEQREIPSVKLISPYKKGQWSPLNPDGTKKYDAEFLKMIQDLPLSKITPNIPAEISSTGPSFKQPASWNQGRKQMNQGYFDTAGADAMSPAYLRPSLQGNRTPLPQRSSQGKGMHRPTTVINIPVAQPKAAFPS
ncbi:uncharacterized protein LOC136026940 isoform X2 [Artemia franciscana]